MIGRFILVASRSVNTVVWGLLFVAIFGPGPMAGIWAIAFRSITGHLAFPGKSAGDVHSVLPVRAIVDEFAAALNGRR